MQIPSNFGPELKQAIVPIIMDELIPEFVGQEIGGDYFRLLLTKFSHSDRAVGENPLMVWLLYISVLVMTNTTGRCSLI